jgi:hypothetical protein
MTRFDTATSEWSFTLQAATPTKNNLPARNYVILLESFKQVKHVADFLPNSKLSTAYERKELSKIIFVSVCKGEAAIANNCTRV